MRYLAEKLRGLVPVLFETYWGVVLAMFGGLVLGLFISLIMRVLSPVCAYIIGII